jgi:predicted O-linked N-acetylglucosamine transferase (SPINDLY family)
MPTSTVTESLIIPRAVVQPSEFYEAEIANNPTAIGNYWYLGLSYLLVGREEDVLATWFIPFTDASDLETERYTEELIVILEEEANHRTDILELETARSIRHYLWVIKPDLLENILKSIVLIGQLNLLTDEDLINLQLLESLADSSIGSIDEELVAETISILAQKLHTELSLRSIDVCLNLLEDTQVQTIAKLTMNAFELFHRHKQVVFAVGLVEICLKFSPTDLDIIQFLSKLYSAVGRSQKAIATAESYARLASNSVEILFASYLIQGANLIAGNWDGSQARLDRHRNLLRELKIDNSQTPCDASHQLIVNSYYSFYLEDNPRVDRLLQNKLAAFYQERVVSSLFKSKFNSQVSPHIAKKTGTIRIGYLASTLRVHSVGWLSRWLFHHHDRSSFEIYIYCVNQPHDDPFNHQWFRDKVDISYYFDINYQEVVAQIREDKIDILIDLDSLTFDFSCLIMAAKPAPVQATWLGLDATGLPAIDYFIVDSYVVPDDADEYYQEQLWRLPQTYVAVEGFEVGIPTLTRQALDIPIDAVVYFSSQSGYKRHPDNIRCQIRIIKAVPNSYLLIKGKSDPEIIRNLFGRICSEEGVNIERLKFLETVADEYTHRANLTIADIVLDTFPYNGATTTLETLWMGIPMVTQVGQQFASRNSYTFMLNAEIEEGIAWNQEEYIEWGIRLGLDPDLRMEIREKLLLGRQTAPVWNAKQFTLDLEQAYREMWTKYQSEKSAISDRYDNN